MDEHIGIDYSLLRDPAVSTDTLDLDFKVKAGSCPAESSCAGCMLGPMEQPGLCYSYRNLSCSRPRACSFHV